VGELGRELRGCGRKWDVRFNVAEPRGIKNPEADTPDPAKRWEHGVLRLCIRPYGHQGRCRGITVGCRREIL